MESDEDVREEVDIENVHRVKSSMIQHEPKKLELKNFEDSIRSESVQDSGDEDIFDMTLETPRIGTNEESIKSKFDFKDLYNQKKRRVSYHRRDSRIGALIGKSSNIRHMESCIEERKYNSQLMGDKFSFLNDRNDNRFSNGSLGVGKPPVGSSMADESAIFSPMIKLEQSPNKLSEDKNLNLYVQQVNKSVEMSNHSSEYKALVILKPNLT